jgi:polar amino acid transport system substrate-binding protein
VNVVCPESFPPRRKVNRPAGYRTGVKALLLAGVAILLLAGCQYPRDPDGTLDRVRGGVMRVGAVEADPWVLIEGEQPSGGAEVELVREFAERLDSRVEWVLGSEEELVGAAKEGQVDLLIGGITNKSRWKKDVAFTRPYAETRTVVGAPPGSSFPDDLAGVEVVVQAGTEEEGLLAQRTDAEVVPVDDLAGARGRPAAVHDFLLDDLELADTGTVLADAKHVMAVRMGENAFLVELERFLLDREGAIRTLLVREGRP